MFKLAFWQLRGESRKIWLVIFCVALGVASRVAVGSFLTGLSHSLLREARNLLSCDIEILSRSPLSAGKRMELKNILPEGSKIQDMTSLLTMAALEGTPRSRLVELRAVDPGYPFFGKLEIESVEGKIINSVPDYPAVYVQKEFLAQINAGLGSSLKIGKKVFRVQGVIKKDPGLGGGVFSLGPKMLIPITELQATGLAESGSRLNYSVTVALPREGSAEETANKIKKMWGLSQKPGRFSESFGSEEGIHVRTAADKQNQIREFFVRLGEYLRLVSLIALLLGGIGVASVVRSYVVERLPSAATLETLGASSSQVTGIFFIQVLVLGAIGSLLGALAGASLQKLLPLLLGGFIPVQYDSALDFKSIGSGIALGLAVSVFFGLLPVLSLKKLKPLQVFRGEASPEFLNRIPWAALALGSASLSALAILESRSIVKGLFFSGSFLGSAGILYALSRFVLPRAALSRKFFSSFGPRHGLSNLARPSLSPYGAATALGLSAFLLGALAVYHSSLLKELEPGGSDKIPTFFVIDIQDDQVADLRAHFMKSGITRFMMSPMIKARYRGYNGEPISDRKILTREDEQAQYFRNREQNLSFREKPGENEKIVRGQWMASAAQDKTEASLEEWFAERLGVKMGDTIKFDVQGVEVEAVITSLRKVNWASFLPTFFIYLTPASLADAPKTWVGSILGVAPDQKDILQSQLVRLFPNLTIIDVGETAARIAEILKKISWAVSFVALFSVLAGLIVLAGLAVSALRQREKESVLLKVLGAGAGTLFSSLLSEFGVLSGLSVLMGLLLSSGFSWILLTYFLDLSFSYPWRQLLSLWALLFLLSSFAGLLTSRKIFSVRPMDMLRAAVFLMLMVSPARAESHVTAELVPQSQSVSPGKSFTVAVRLRMTEGWHTYSDPPGDSGLPTQIIWDLPQGFSAGKILWPAPKKITESGITNYVYENAVDLKVKISPPRTIDRKKIVLKAKVKWLECKDICQPGSAWVQAEVLIKP